MTNKRTAGRTMKNVICLAVMASASCYFISIGQTSEVKHQETHTVEKGSELHLSDDLKVILNQEMKEIEAGMMKIIHAISAGNWEIIADIAKNIKDSFILKQKLTKQQMKELHHSLSAEFVEMDQNFHSTAAKLSRAAHQQDGELVNFYFYRLHSQCMSCHSKYATERFSNFKKIQQGKSGHQ